MDARWFGDCRCHMQDNFEIEAGTYKKMTNVAYVPQDFGNVRQINFNTS